MTIVNIPPPAASLKAYDAIKRNGVDKNQRTAIYNAIVIAMAMLERATVTAGDIAMYCEINYYQINKRLSELVREPKSFVASETGGVSPSGRKCRTYGVIG